VAASSGNKTIMSAMYGTPICYKHLCINRRLVLYLISVE